MERKWDKQRKIRKQGIYNTINKYDIICLTEIWQDRENKNNIKKNFKTLHGYKEIKHATKKNTEKQKRGDSYSM